MLGVTFGSKHSYNDWGIWLEDTHINPPLPKRYIVDVPARNGLLDLTPELTPTIRFENRTLTFNFRVKAGDWSTLVSQIYGQIHGQTLDVVSDLDPNWHWHGCVTVDDFSSDERTGKLVITVDADPFKLSNTENSYTVNGNGTITCVVDRMEISPAFELTASTTVIYGDSSYVIESTATTEKTVSGDIVSFADGTANPAVDLTADIEAVQDLHGYDHPWVGGAGKNLFDGSAVAPTTPANWGVTFSNDTLSIQHKNSYSTGNPALVLDLAVGTYVASFASITENASISLYVDSAYNKVINSGTTIDIESGHTYELRFSASANSTNSIVKMQIESGSTPSNYEPYANICPISGWDEAKVWVNGKNLLNYEKWKTVGATRATAVWENNGVTITATSTDGFTRVGDLYWKNEDCIRVEEGDDISITWEADENNAGKIYLFKRNDDGTDSVISYVDNATTKVLHVPSVPSGVKRVCFRFGVSTNGQTIHYKNIMFRRNGDATFVPSQTTTYSVTWTDSGTVYGGTLDVTTGVLTIDKAEVDLGTMAYNYTSSYNGLFYANLPLDAKLIIGTAGSMCSNYAQTSGSDWQYLSNGEYILRKELMNIGRCAIAIRDDSYTNATDFKNALTTNNAQLVYELATPQVVQLTAEQVMILKNQNNIWADSGEVEVTYLAQDFAGKTFYIPDLELTEGSHALTIQGTGTTTVTYTNGRL